MPREIKMLKTAWFLIVGQWELLLIKQLTLCSASFFEDSLNTLYSRFVKHQLCQHVLQQIQRQLLKLMVMKVITGAKETHETENPSLKRSNRGLSHGQNVSCILLICMAILYINRKTSKWSLLSASLNGG